METASTERQGTRDKGMRIRNNQTRGSEGIAFEDAHLKARPGEFSEGEGELIHGEIILDHDQSPFYKAENLYLVSHRHSGSTSEGHWI